VLGGVVERAVGVRRLSFTTQGQSTTGVNIDVTRKKATGPAKGYASLLCGIKIFTRY
jgi:hypothetical protein